MLRIVAAGAVVALLVVGCSGGGVAVSKPAGPEYPLVGTWIAEEGCFHSGTGEQGDGPVTLTFTRSRWIQEVRCMRSDGSNIFVAHHSGEWLIEGTTVTRSRVLPTTAGTVLSEGVKEISWGSGGDTFSSHPFYWPAYDRPSVRRTYTRLDRPPLSLVGHWRYEHTFTTETDAERVVHENAYFGADGSFRFSGETYEGTALVRRWEMVARWQLDADELFVNLSEPVVLSSGSFEPDNMPVIAFAPVRRTDAVVLSMAWETVNRDDGSSVPILSENDGSIYWLFLTRVNDGE